MSRDCLYVCTEAERCKVLMKPDEECFHAVPHRRDEDCLVVGLARCLWVTGADVPIPAVRASGCVELSVVVVRDERCLDEF